MKWELELPYPPAINKRLAALYGKNIYSRAARSYALSKMTFKKSVFIIFKESGLPSFGEKMIKVNVEIFCPDKRRRDADGIIKELFDAMQDAGCFDNDYQIKKYSVERSDDTHKNGKIIVSIEPID